MPLQYIIDAYNLINHPAFRPSRKPFQNIQQALADFIKLNKLAGSKNNSVILVFDGYPPGLEEIPRECGLLCVFSRVKEADELIKEIIQGSAFPKDIVVVSDDKEVQLSSRFFCAQICSVEKFICGKKSNKTKAGTKLLAAEFKLSYAKMQKINDELKRIWLE